MNKEHPDFLGRTKYLMGQFKIFPSMFKSGRLRLLILFNIESLLEQGKRDDQIFLEIGLKTKDSKSKCSRRAMMFLDESTSFSDKGLALTESTKAICLEQYRAALDFFRHELSKQTNTIQLVGIHGSIAQHTARFGVAPVGVMYEYQYIQHRLSTAERRRAEKSGDENPYVSDIDILYKVQNADEVEQAKVTLEELSKRVFDEFGVLIHLQSTRDIYLSQDEYLPLPQMDQLGGLVEYICSESPVIPRVDVMKRNEESRQ